MKNIQFSRVNPLYICSGLMPVSTIIGYIVSRSPAVQVMAMCLPIVLLILSYKLSMGWVRYAGKPSESKHLVAYAAKVYFNHESCICRAEFDDWRKAKIAAKILAYWADHIGMISDMYGIDYKVETKQSFYRTYSQYAPDNWVPA